MAVDLMMAFRNDGFVTKLEENAVQEAASGLESVNKLIRLLSQQNQEKLQSSSSPSSTSRSSMDIDMDCKAAADVAVSKFKKVISLLGRTRTGHARFRRAPVATPLSHSQISQENQVLDSKVYYATPIQQIPPPPPVPNHYYHDFSSMAVMPKNNGVISDKKESSTTINFSYPSAGNSFASSLTGDATDSKQLSSSSAFQIQITNMSQVSSAGKPPLSSSSLKRKCSSENLGSGKCSGSSGRCHCSKKSRKLRLRRVVRVPAISLKMADIPPDDYSWRKYGQKPIKGSPHPRGYYKCSSVRGCPARKHVERALDDPSMLVVTYEGEHSHTLSIAETTNLILESS
ncbi:hypothetical protein P3X46_012527 [Hevea brasiliensis]|uniref:WRKY domain-containing protein n=1 Tax=Hevea brasiliensis TaxID=3981 RepID=A0ABQ9MAH4_HEVBR|nr:probable WRKY transcription factor 15 isoform X1 [Hevea brasiliensis]KAJ9177292.1 hypothetical protein P3X46_012527 [Hevea brasiliensis]